ncbi:uncharacterized protein B0I36DRAFT_332003 [Microdochium trichocladiopsis]|uniref:Uncharacterized protein n=1 Tax=Microdochium trichocladiopsis TaxID=1682393 RepID=A0A9P8XY76_9PEZI|nr:uncharacterized protein B0I36DRAFT_332003 [Microdochium trichocladiopsis]KAH7024754.1 hypothetical protein B0I36DRAFT_332003 [Microdochium trichocladiopsis]
MDIVESYSARNLTKTEDRFLALSGVAARYQARKPQDLYMAGLWYDNIAQGLAWTVQSAVQRHPDRPKMHECPSWSWASLPIPTPVRMSRNTTGSQRSRFEVLHTDKDLAPGGEDAVVSVSRGSQIKSLTIRGRIRPLCSSSSRVVSWSSVTVRTAITPSYSQGQTDTFTFHDWLDQEVHSINGDTGTIVAYQPRMKELVAQLDYLDSVEGIQMNPSVVTCLEISDRAMLLLMPASNPQNEEIPQFTRMGVSMDFREDFFSGLKETVIRLQ